MNYTEKNKILIAGAAILDVLISPAEPEVFIAGSYPADEIKMTFGGDALNEAIVLASHGKKVYLNTIFGNDTEGNIIQNYCEELGIELNNDCKKDGLQTGINVVLVQKNGERNFLTNKNGSLRKLTKEDVLRFLPDDAGILCFASIFVYPEIGDKEMAEIFKAAKEKGMLVCADMTKRKKGEIVKDIAEALTYIDYLMPNEEESYLVTGADTPEESAKILHQAGVGHVIIKCGKKGCYICDNDGGRYISAVKGVTSVDSTGAGDSFAAGFVYGLSEGWDIEKCAEFANQCGAKAVAQVGATSWCMK